MDNLDLVVRNGTVVTAADTQACDIGVRGGRIVALAQGLPKAAHDIDATGKLVLPGGVEGHCHIEQKTSAGRSADDFYSGTLSATCGGTTTVIPFAAQHRGNSLRAVVDDYRKLAEEKAVIDYAFHLIVSDPNAQALGQELPSLVKDGITSFKIYMCYDAWKVTDRQVLDVLDAGKREGALAMIHAENHDCAQFLADGLVAAGKTEARYQVDSRPVPVEREATHRAIMLAEIAEAPMLIVHVSSRAAVDQIRWAQAKGLPIMAETCPHYLTLTEEHLHQPDAEASKYLCSPPPRTTDDQEVLWTGLRTGVFQVLSSDHAASAATAAPGAPFFKRPQGMAGLETRLPVFYSEGVRTGRISIEEFVTLTATNPARIYGLYPQKGTIAVGSDADIAIWDTEKEVAIANKGRHHQATSTPFEGMRVTGWPVTTISRGDVVWDKGQVNAARGRGRFVSCAVPPAVLKAQSA